MRTRLLRAAIATSAALVVAALVVAACGSGGGSGGGFTAVPLPPRTVVLSPGQLENSEFDDDADWTPTAGDIRAAEPLLRTRAAREPGLRPLGEYHRQYAGVRGHALVVNALCRVDDLPWRSGWITVSDGGSCYWLAVIRDGRVERFSVNGQA